MKEFFTEGSTVLFYGDSITDAGRDYLSECVAQYQQLVIVTNDFLKLGEGDVEK